MFTLTPTHKSIRIDIITGSLWIFSLLIQPTLGQSCQLQGYIKGIANKPVIFGYQQNGTNYKDTIFARQDRFTYLAKPSDDGQITLTITRGRYTSFWYEPGTIQAVGVIEKPYQLTFTGTPENNVQTRYDQTIRWPYESRRQEKLDSLRLEEQQETLQFIQQHPATRTSADLLYWQTFYNEQLLERYEKLFANLAVSVKTSDQGEKVAKRLLVLRNQPVIGKKAPLFTLPDTTGTPLSLAAYRGKYVLLDFWGHWCGPCLRSFPKLKQLQQAYSEQLVLVGVAAEYASDKAIWQQTIKANNLTWVHVSELKSDKGEVTQAYNVTAYPTYFLLDKEGIVLTKANDLETIEQQLKALDK